MKFLFEKDINTYRIKKKALLQLQKAVKDKFNIDADIDKNKVTFNLNGDAIIIYPNVTLNKEASKDNTRDNTKRYEGNGLVKDGFLYDEDDKKLGKAYYGIPVNKNIYDYSILDAKVYSSAFKGTFDKFLDKFN